jgi:hypothetical protein
MYNQYLEELFYKRYYVQKSTEHAHCSSKKIIPYKSAVAIDLEFVTKKKKKDYKRETTDIIFQKIKFIFNSVDLVNRKSTCKYTKHFLKIYCTLVSIVPLVLFEKI